MLETKPLYCYKPDCTEHVNHRPWVYFFFLVWKWRAPESASHVWAGKTTARRASGLERASPATPPSLRPSPLSWGRGIITAESVKWNDSAVRWRLRCPLPKKQNTILLVLQSHKATRASKNNEVRLTKEYISSEILTPNILYRIQEQAQFPSKFQWKFSPFVV
jgi:hypothetical protein